MVRETVMVPVTWERGEFPVLSPVRGEMSGWPMPKTNKNVPGDGSVPALEAAVALFPPELTHSFSPFIAAGDTIDFEPGTKLPAHFTHWRYPKPESYVVSPPEKPNTLRLSPSRLNLTALNRNYVGPEGQTFVGRRLQDTLFTFSVDLDFSPRGSDAMDAEAGVSAFLTQNHHLDLGIVMLPAASRTGAEDAPKPAPHFRFHGISYVPMPTDIVVPVPEAWRDRTLRLEIRASNATHYVFSVGLAGAMSQMRTLLEVSNAPVSWGFTGVILGVYCTSNGYDGTTPAYFSRWRYTPQGQFRD